LGTGLSGWVVESGRPIVNGNPTVEKSLLTTAGLFTASSSALSIPLFASDRSVFGALTLYSHEHAAFSSEHLQMLQAVQLEFTLALQNALSRETTAAHEPAERIGGANAPVLAGSSVS
jgi:GAF domain-containing protein